MKSRLLTTIGKLVLVLGNPILANASLIGDTVNGCSGPSEEIGLGQYLICVPGSGGSWFDNDTAVVVDPGVEFTGSTSNSTSDITFSSDFRVSDLYTPTPSDVVRISLSFSSNTTRPFTMEGQSYVFTDLDWSDGRIITGLTILGEGYPIRSMAFGPHSLEFVTHQVPNQTGAYTLATTVLINTSPIPVPPALYLFGSGLLGLVGVARKRAA